MFFILETILLKKMSRLDDISKFLKEPVFQKLFNISEYSKLTTEEREIYDFSQFHKWDYVNTIRYAKKEVFLGRF